MQREQRSSLFKTKQKYTHRKEWVSTPMRSIPERWFKSLIWKQFFLGFLFPLASHLSSFPTSDLTQGSSWIYLCIFLPRWILAWKPIGDWQHLLWDSAPPFLTPKSFYTCAVLEILTSGVIDAIILFLDSSRAQLLLLTLSLKCLGKQRSSLPTWQSPAVQLRDRSTSTSEPWARICWETSFTTLTVGLADPLQAHGSHHGLRCISSLDPLSAGPAGPLLSERIRAGMVLGPGGSLWGSSPAIAQRQGSLGHRTHRLTVWCQQVRTCLLHCFRRSLSLLSAFLGTR